MKKLLFKVLFVFSLLLAVLFIGSSKVEAAIKVAPGAYCWNGPNGQAKCRADVGEVVSYTGQVIVNGWVNYGPWAPRPGFGVIIP